MIQCSFVHGFDFMRNFMFINGYLLEVVDRISNVGDQVFMLSEYGVNIGFMSTIQTKSKMYGIMYFGVDTFEVMGGGDVKYWGKKLSRVFGVKISYLFCVSFNVCGKFFIGSMCVGMINDWVVVKNKFFVQILVFVEVVIDCEIVVFRDSVYMNILKIVSVFVNLKMNRFVFEFGETYMWWAIYYVGFKKYLIFCEFDRYQYCVMQFGWWEWF